MHHWDGAGAHTLERCGIHCAALTTPVSVDTVQCPLLCAELLPATVGCWFGMSCIWLALMRWVELTASVRLAVPVRAGSVQWVDLCVRPADANYFVPLPLMRAASRLHARLISNCGCNCAVIWTGVLEASTIVSAILLLSPHTLFCLPF